MHNGVFCNGFCKFNFKLFRREGIYPIDEWHFSVSFIGFYKTIISNFLDFVN